MLNVFMGSNNPTFIEFSIYHLLMILAVLLFQGLLVFLFAKSKDKTQKIILDIMSITIFLLLTSDWLIVTIRDGFFDIGRLPFHLCTCLGVLVLLTRFIKPLKRFMIPVSSLSIIASFFYLVFPLTATGYPLFSYTPLQTIIYHALLNTYGILSFQFEGKDNTIEEDWLRVIISMAFIVLVSTLGNIFIPGRDYFFLNGDTFRPFVPWIQPWHIYFSFPPAIIMISYGLYAIKNIKNNRSN